MEFNDVNWGGFLDLGFDFQLFSPSFKFDKLCPHGFAVQPVRHRINDLLDTAVGRYEFFFAVAARLVTLGPDIRGFFIERSHKAGEGFFRKQMSIKTFQDLLFERFDCNDMSVCAGAAFTFAGATKFCSAAYGISTSANPAMNQAGKEMFRTACLMHGHILVSLKLDRLYALP